MIHSNSFRRQSAARSKGHRWSFADLEPRLMLAGDVGAAVAGPVAEVQVTQVDSVAFVDASLQDLDVLTSALPPDVELVLLDPQRDFIDQISDTMGRVKNVSQIHLLTHGDEGSVLLGNQRLDLQLLQERADEVGHWGASLKQGGDFLVYGCNSAAGNAGNQFMTALAKITGADVAASTNLTGSTDLGGDWNLEFQLGEIESPLLVRAEAQDQFRSTLQIVVNAWGSTGEEVFNIVVDNEVLATFEVEQTWQPYVIDAPGGVTPNRVVIEFVNDLYEPESGIDRNLTVDNVVVNGSKFESENFRTLSTGTWLASDGVTEGYGRGDTLHANGFFQYDQDIPSSTAEFAGFTWFASSNSSVEVVSLPSTSDILLVETDRESTGSAWAQLDVQAGSTIELFLDGRRQTLGRVSSGQPIANSAVGIDFLDADGNEIGEILTPVGSSRSVIGVVPEGTEDARIWVWVDDLPFGLKGRAYLFDLSVESVETP